MEKIKVLLITMIILVLSSPVLSFAEAKKEKNKQPPSLDTINKKEAAENVSNSLKELANLFI